MIINSYIFVDPDPILAVPGLISYLTPNTIDAAAVSEGDDVDTWTDSQGNNNATNTGTASPELHITGGGQRQVTFDGTEDYLTWQADGGTMDFVPGTDDFFIIIKFGEGTVATSNSGCFVCKSTGTSATRQYQIEQTSSNVLAVWIGGTNIPIGTNNPAANDLIIVNVSATADVYYNDTQPGSNETIGTNTTSQAVEIGGREGGGYNTVWDAEFIAIGSGELTAQEITDITAYHNVN